MTAVFWQGRSVFLTGHTGFKGGWLALWLARLGAQVHGYALAPAEGPNLFTAARVADSLASHTVGDLRDAAALTQAMRAAQPDIVLHLAAQPLVRLSYAQPVETYTVNVLGTVHLFEAVRQCASVRGVLNVTTDKCYDNREWAWGYRENEPMGGRDPYSSSKGCAELVTASYRHSFFEPVGVALASARAGNVIGGGDWALDRLLPDFFRALDAGSALPVRFPGATRPWQHVLEPLSGYLRLARGLVEEGSRFARGWNFGPSDDDARPVSWILDRLVGQFPQARWHHTGAQLHEAGYLKLDSSQARQELGWRPRWDLATALGLTIDWHQSWRAGADMQALCMAQIAAHEAAARAH